MASNTTTTTTPSPNLHIVTSSDHFKSLLSADLERISLINFWAPWADPCKQMNDVVIELSKKYPQILVLQVEAEDQAEIAESFDVEAVPHIILLRGHTLLDRISGANASALTQSLEKHTRTPSLKPLSTTNQTPIRPSSSSPSFSSSSAEVTAPQQERKETEEELNTRLKRLMTQSKVVLFMKGSPDAPRCGFSRKISGLLREQGVPFVYFDILTDESVRQGLKKLNDWPTFPQLIVKGELVGGLDIVQEMVDSGEFKEMVV